LFAAAKPKSPAIATFGRLGSFSEVASQLVMQYTFVNDHLMPSVVASPAARGPQGAAFVQSVKDLISVADARQDPAARRFLEALGRLAARQFYAQNRMTMEMMRRGVARPEPRHMPRNALGDGDYWDMAAGMNAANFILTELEPGTRYSFFDLSPFVVSYLQSVAQLAGKDKDVVVMEGSILELERPAQPLSVLRNKNAVAYVAGFEKKFAEMADWVAPGGRLVIQNDPMAGQRQLILQKHSELALRLLQQGWDMSIEFESQRGAQHALDTLIFTRPKGAATARTAAQARQEWQRYVDAVQKVNQEEHFGSFFRGFR
jgi:SAM-dependent methyltransferase